MHLKSSVKKLTEEIGCRACITEDVSGDDDRARF
jgi:hypothetical protein